MTLSDDLPPVCKLSVHKTERLSVCLSAAKEMKSFLTFTCLSTTPGTGLFILLRAAAEITNRVLPPGVVALSVIRAHSTANKPGLNHNILNRNIGARYFQAMS